MSNTRRQSINRSVMTSLALALITACGDQLGVANRTSEKRPAAAPAPASDRMDRSQELASPAPMKVTAASTDVLPHQAAALPTRATDAPSANDMIIRTGNASVLVDSLEPAIAKVTQMAVSLGGFVSNTQVQSGESQVRSATIELKLPTARFEEATGSLAPLGKVEFINAMSEDVGEEFVDVSARMANSRRLEERLVQLLAQRTGKLQDVLSVERELARVREEIERAEGRLRYLKTRVSMSTLSVAMHEKAPVVSSNPDENVIGEAFVSAWRNFVLFLAGAIASLGWIVPIGGLVAVGVLGARRILRRPGADVAPKQA